MQLTSVVSTLALATSVLAADMSGAQTDQSQAQGMPMTMAKGTESAAAAAAATTAKDGAKSAEATAKASGKKGASPMTHKIMVSDDKGSLKFNPQTVQADVGHMVEFMFHPMNHSVAQAAYDKPCMPMDMAMPGMTGFYSGFMPVSGKESKTFTVMVNSTQPMWFYCSQASHCQKGMVGAINPPAASSGQSMQGFMDGAKKAGMSVSPSKVAGGCDKEKTMHGTAGAAKGSGKAKPTGGMKKTKAIAGVARPSGVAAASGAAAAAGNATSPTAPSAASAAVSSAPAAAAAAAAAPANSSAPVKSANAAAGGSSDFLSSSSPLSLIGLLAAGFYFCA